MKVSRGHRFTVKVALLIGLVAFMGHAFSGPFTEAAEEGGASNIVDPYNPKSILYLDTEGKLAGVGDASTPASEAYRAGMGWHPQALSAEGLPKDRYGLVDWTRIINEKMLTPRHSLDPSKDEFPPLNMDIVMPVMGQSINDVNFPHETHTYWLNCEVCHPKMFVPKKGANQIDMSAIAEGEWCGRCHGKVAFPLTDCNRCHNTPKKAAQ